jgi:hypothetical protein
VKPANYFAVTFGCRRFCLARKGNMRECAERSFYVALIIAIGILAYKLTEQGLADAISTELKRYSDLNLRHVSLIGVFVIGSFPVGWALSRFRIRN